MALLYDPGSFMPRRPGDFLEMSWMITWPTGPWHLHDVMPGGTVYLVRAGDDQRIVWETTVTRSFAVPYEAIDDLATEVWLRWGLSIDTSAMNSGGFCIGWQAKPIARLDRGPLDVCEAASAAEAEALDLDGCQSTEWETPVFRRRWGLPIEDETLCTGRAPIGWFGMPA